MAHLVIAFGPNDSYFWQAPTEWAWRGLPEGLAAQFLPSAGDCQIKYVYEIALGANGSYYAGWRGKDGKNYSLRHGLPTGLSGWLAKNNHPETMRVSLGPNNTSYWASNQATGASIWNGLPESLSSSIKTMAVKFLSLGVGQTFIMVSKGGGATWNLGRAYPDLDKSLDQVNMGGAGAFSRVHHVSLSAHQPRVTAASNNDKYCVILFTDGAYFGDVPDGSEADITKVMESAKSRAGAAKTRQQSTSTTKNVAGFLRLANSGLKLVNALAAGAAGQQVNYSSSDSGSFGGATFDTSAFTAGLQQDTWSTTQPAAQDPIQ